MWLSVWVLATAQGGEPAPIRADAPVSPRPVELRFRGAAAPTEAPLTFDLADFDGDGIPDLVCGFRGKRVTLHRGNAGALYPNHPATTGTAPFQSVGTVTPTRRNPVWLATGDFDGDGRRDVVLADRGTAELEWLRGDGRGGFSPSLLPLSGPVTAFAVGEFGRVDGLADLALAVAAPEGARLLLFVSSRGALAAPSQEIPLVGKPKELILGDTDGDGLRDLVARGELNTVIYGDHRPVIERDIDSPLRVERFSKDAPPRAGREADPPQLPGSAIDFRRARLDPDGVPDLLVLHSTEPYVTASRSTSGATFTVSNTDDTGPGSLRQAIVDTNASPGADRILFDIPGSGPFVIQPLSALGALSEPVLIDGTSQPGYADVPLIVLDGSLAGISDGLVLFGGQSVVRGLVLQNWQIAGIFITISGDNIVEGNFIGTDASGMSAAGNDRGVEVGSSDNRIGGATLAARNVISGQIGPGILIDGNDVDGTEIQGNLVGVDATGVGALGNGGAGIDWFETGSGGIFNVIGGTDPGKGNLISGNDGTGIRLRGNAVFVRVQGNLIGTAGDGSSAIGNLGAGVRIENSTNHTIGGSQPARNIISGNLTDPPDPGAGVEIVSLGGSAIRNAITANYIGVDATGSVALANPIGVRIEADENDIGSSAQPNVISGNTLEGVRISGNRNDVLGNFIGTDSTGAFAIANGGDGVLLEGAGSEDNLIRSSRTLSGNLGWGVRVSGVGTPTLENKIFDNRIGTDESATFALGNALGGVRIEGSTNTVIGGSFAGTANLISGNGQDGISSLSDVTILGNVIGLDATGTAAIPNGRHGVFISGPTGPVVGGSSTNERNVVSGNTASGIRMQSVTSAEVRGNYVGSDSTGTLPLPNQVGIEISAFTGLTLDDNLVSGNTDSGIALISGTGATLTDNLVGTTDALDPLGNGGDGIRLSGVSLSQIGSGLGGNTIASNGGAGISMIAGTSTTIGANRLFDNGGLGIDLENDGVTANDPGDVDSGANNLQNFPTLGAALRCGFEITIDAGMESTASSDFMVDLYFTDACDPSGHGEGTSKFATELVTTDGAGFGAFLYNDFIGVLGQFPEAVTATATDTGGNTSEFSQCLPFEDLAPNSAPQLAWTPGSTTSLDWSPAPTAVLLHRGTDDELPGILSSPSIGCTMSFPVSTTSGDLFVEVPDPERFFWYVARLANECGAGPVLDASSGRRFVGGAPCCAHGFCEIGDPLDATCDVCVDQICAVDPFCCSGLWDASCTEAVVNVCGRMDCDPQGTCPGSLCETQFGAPFTAGCDQPPIVPSCVDQVCAEDTFCCSDEWDEVCVGEVGSICGLVCPFALVGP